jgi:metal-dependent amidase/aminoacylase/carboxypeptidase family protein
LDKQYHLEVIEKFKRCAEAGALAAGARLEMEEISPIYEPLHSNAVLEDVFRANLKAIGWEEATDERKGMGSTDIGNITQVVPGIHPGMAIGPKEMVGHSHEMCVASASPEGDRCVIDAAKVMALSAIDILTTPELREKAWREFNGK